MRIYMKVVKVWVEMPEENIPTEVSAELINTEIIPVGADACLMRGRRISKWYDSHPEWWRSILDEK